MIVAMDLNGGDHAPKAVIKGMELAIINGYVKPEELVGIGTASAIDRAMKEKKLRKVELLECPEIILMGDGKNEIIKKKESTIAVGLRGVRDGEYDAFVSAGNTAAMVIWGALILSRLKRGLSPAIAVPLPNEQGPCLLLDAGAIHNATSEDLANCALMGTIYAERVWQINNPVVRLLNIGHETGKGNDSLKQGHQLLLDLHQQDMINFGGNIEGDEIFIEPANVIVCSGEIGNNTIKVAEGVKKLMEKNLAISGKSSLFSGATIKKPITRKSAGLSCSASTATSLSLMANPGRSLSLMPSAEPKWKLKPMWSAISKMNC